MAENKRHPAGERHPAIVKVSPVLGADAVEIVFKHPDGMLEMLRISGTDMATADRVNDLITGRILRRSVEIKAGVEEPLGAENKPASEGKAPTGAERWADKWLEGH